ncbi:porin [Bradyrhizobium macuxiense]|uniref:Porin n=1 Tax=Bradyrhizobium macuxiense TaxID=1755647 RepID=A0A560L144_9BRAD|nr:carbohydrate porin [Bradyrhizobium macuxiense]TWB86900.1 porin [Bradyrhizobium macuxiense]
MSKESAQAISSQDASKSGPPPCRTMIALRPVTAAITLCALSSTSSFVQAQSSSDRAQQRTRPLVRLQSLEAAERAEIRDGRTAMNAARQAQKKVHEARSKTEAKTDYFAKFDNLREKGLVVGIPGPADTVDQDAGGFRSALADLGIGYWAWSQISFADNVLPNAARSTIANQLYNGQNPTLSTENFVTLTYDLSRYGIADGQIVVGAVQQKGTWNPGAPETFGFSSISYYQTFFDRRLELKLGYLKNSWEFAGAVNGAASVFGPSGSILVQGGMTYAVTPTPAINLKYNFDDRLYTKLSFQRSTTPAGVVAQLAENPTSLGWSTPNAGLLFLDETGYKNSAALGSPETWLRAGVGINNSRYTNLAYPSEPEADENSFYYVAADRQLFQTDIQGSASRGYYGGFSVMHAPPDLNRVSQYYELRLYAKGLFDSRPTDIVSFVAADTVWSNIAVETALAAGKLVHGDAKSVSANYSAHLAPGIYTSVGITYIDHPTSIAYTPQIGHVLNFSVTTNIFF